MFITTANRDIPPGSRQNSLNQRSTQFKTSQGRRARTVEGDTAEECAHAQR